MNDELLNFLKQKQGVKIQILNYFYPQSSSTEQGHVTRKETWVLYGHLFFFWITTQLWWAATQAGNSLFPKPVYSDSIEVILYMVFVEDPCGFLFSFSVFNTCVS